jgi:hypothetical protein
VVQAALAAEPPPRLATNRNLIRLEPRLLVVSCERIKADLWSELGVSGPWRGCVFVTIYPALTTNDTVTISSELVGGRWCYKVLMPEMLPLVRYLRATTQVVLLELANRALGLHGAEVPAWLSEGLTRYLLATREPDVLVPPYGESIKGRTLGATVIDRARQDPLRDAHQDLLARQALTFQELSWPTEGQLAGERGEHYGNSAHLFVVSLLRLPGGRASLREFLAALPQHYNWQFAFLKAFRAQFSRPGDVDKWWDLQVANFTGRSLTQAWPTEESWRKLEEAVRLPIQVRTGTNELPIHAQATLQNAIRDYDPEAQTYVLETKLKELELLRFRVAQGVAPMVDSYRQVIKDYLRDRDRLSFPMRLGKQAARRHAAKEALRQLDALETKRQALSPPATGLGTPPAAEIRPPKAQVPDQDKTRVF